MPRAFLIVLDSVAVGGAPDARRFGDEGADTVGHIAARRAAEGRPLNVPCLAALGLGECCRLATGSVPPGLEAPQGGVIGSFGTAIEQSDGKDTPSGHWEIAGVPVTTPWGYFPATVPCFPAALVDAIVTRARLPGILGNCHASGTDIIAALGDEHVATGKPICYTSVDSVLQIAAHEEHFGLERLYEVCEITRELTRPLHIGRVIARPFTGHSPATYRRTPHRRDYAEAPPAPTLLDIATHEGRSVVSLGKVADIFAHSGTGRVVKGPDNAALLESLLAEMPRLADGGLVFANLVDFDQEHGHRRDVEGYALTLEAFDRSLPGIMARLADDDLLVITADHGCDPTWHGTDHTREQVPILAYGRTLGPGSVGTRPTYADIGASIAKHLALPRPGHGEPFL